MFDDTFHPICFMFGPYIYYLLYLYQYNKCIVKNSIISTNRIILIYRSILIIISY